jgi:hypothetical protein
MDYSSGKTNQEKWMCTFYTTILFFVIVNPMTYKLVNKLLRRFVTIADRAGCPTFSGMLVHGVVFALLFRLMMDMGNLIEGNRGGRLADPRYNDEVEVEKLKNNKSKFKKLKNKGTNFKKRPWGKMQQAAGQAHLPSHVPRPKGM